MARMQDTMLIYKSKLLSYISAMNKNKWNLKFKHNAIYTSIQKNEILRYKANKVCVRSI